MHILISSVPVMWLLVSSLCLTSVLFVQSIWAVTHPHDLNQSSHVINDITLHYSAKERQVFKHSSWVRITARRWDVWAASPPPTLYLLLLACNAKVHEHHKKQRLILPPLHPPPPSSLQFCSCDFYFTCFCFYLFLNSQYHWAKFNLFIMCEHISHQFQLTATCTSQSSSKK